VGGVAVAEAAPVELAVQVAGLRVELEVLVAELEGAHTQQHRLSFTFKFKFMLNT